MKQRELEMIQKKLKQTTYGAQLEHIKNLEETISQEEQVVVSASPSLTPLTDVVCNIV